MSDRKDGGKSHLVDNRIENEIKSGFYVKMKFRFSQNVSNEKRKRNKFRGFLEE